MKEEKSEGRNTKETRWKRAMPFVSVTTIVNTPCRRLVVSAEKKAKIL